MGKVSLNISQPAPVTPSTPIKTPIQVKSNLLKSNQVTCLIFHGQIESTENFQDKLYQKYKKKYQGKRIKYYRIQSSNSFAFSMVIATLSNTASKLGL